MTATPRRIELPFLRHLVRIALPDEDTAKALSLMTHRAEHAVEPDLRMSYAVRHAERRAGTLFDILEEGDHLATVEGHEQVLEAIYVRVHRRAFELASLSGWMRMHAATADVEGVRVLLCGASGSGKSSSVLRLGLDGATVGSDESTLVRDGRSIGVPRRFHLKRDAHLHIPALATALADVPSLGEGEVRAFDPTSAGIRWRVEEAPVDVIVLLDDIAAPTLVRRVDTGEALSMVVHEVFRLCESRLEMVRGLAELLSRARVVRVRGAGGVDLTSLVREVSAR